MSTDNQKEIDRLRKLIEERKNRIKEIDKKLDSNEKRKELLRERIKQRKLEEKFNIKPKTGLA